MDDIKKTLFELYIKATDGLDILPSGKQKIIISFCDGKQRAQTVKGIGNSFQNAFQSAQGLAIKYIKEKDSPPKWIMLDVVTKETSISIDEYYSLLRETRRGYLRYGVSFDDFYNTAFLEKELYGNSLIRYIDKNTQFFNIENIQNYLIKNRKVNKDFKFELPPSKKMIIFETQGYFYDNGRFYGILNASDGYLKGMRNIAIGGSLSDSRNFVLDLISKSAEYLLSTLEDTGRFVYGYFSCFDAIVPGYNSVRHALSVIALADAFMMTTDEKYKDAAIKALDYLISEFVYYFNENTAFLLDYNGDNAEIKLGGLGVSILAITKCMEFLGYNEKYYRVAASLGNGILYLQNKETGNFTHVLNYPSLEVADEFRIVYYAGEAAYALTRLYSIDKDKKWLDSLKLAFEFFIENDYHKYSDHWLAYAVNELVKYLPEDRYFDFGLKNAFYDLDFIIKRDTTWNTFLEMLNASYLLVQNILLLKKDYLLNDYDVDKLHYAINVRFKMQLASIMFPEMAMFFKAPEKILHGVFIRHHSFRIRNDDVAHHLMGYSNYYRYMFLKDVDIHKVIGEYEGANEKVKGSKMRDIESELLNRVKILFLIDNISAKRNGIVTSVIRKVKMMEDRWDYKPFIITKDYNLSLRKNIKELINSKELNQDSLIFNMYEYFQGTSFETQLIENKKDDELLNYKEISKGTYKVYDGDRHIRTETWDAPNAGLRKIEVYRNDAILDYIAFYDDFGYLSKKQIFNSDDEKNFVQEQFFGIDGTCKITINYHIRNDKNTVKEIHLNMGNGIIVFKSELDLFVYYVNEIIKNDNFLYIVIAERIRLSEVPLRINKNNVIKSAVIHNAFLKDPYDLSSNPTNIYSVVCKRTNEFDGIVALTNQAKEDLETVTSRYCGNKSDNIYVIAHAYPASFIETDFNTRDLKKVVAVARFDAQKRLDLAIRIFGRVIQKVPDAVFEIYGFGSSDERAKIDKTIAEVNAEKNIIVKGFTSEPYKVFQSAVLALSTSKNEGFPLSILESLSNGCPVISYDIKYGPSDQIENDCNGYLFPFGNIDEYSDKIIELLNNKEKLCDLSKNAFAKACSDFSIDKYLKDWYSFIEDMVSKHEKTQEKTEKNICSQIETIQKENERGKKVSFVVVVHDGKVNLQDTLFESLEKQSYKNTEIIVAVKNARSIVENIKNKKILNIPNDKDCFIEGAKNASGDYIIFLEQSDSFTSNWVYSAVKSAELQEADMVMTPIACKDMECVKYFNNDPLQTADFNLSNGDAFKEYLKVAPSFKSFLTIGNKLIRRDLFEKCADDLERFFINQPPDFFGYQEVFCSRLFFNSVKCIGMRNHLYIYDAQRVSVERYLKSTDFNKICAVYGQVLDFVGELIGDNSYYYENFRKSSLKRLISYLGKVYDISTLFVQKIVSEYFKIKPRMLNLDVKADNYFEAITTELYPYYKEYEDIVAFITNPETEYVMFDAFDTLMLRPFWNPSDLFQLLGMEFSKSLDSGFYIDFARIRGVANAKCERWAKEKYGEGHIKSINDIYDYISETYEIDKAITDATMDAEIELELKYCSARKTAKELFELAQHHKKKIVVISDMYLSGRIILNMLEKCGYSNFEIFVSNEGNGSKASGRLYEYVKNHLSINDTTKSCMIGDNLKHDVVNAQKAGYKAFHLPSVSSKLSESEAYKQVYFSDKNAIMHNQPSNHGIKALLKIVGELIYDFPFIPENKEIPVNDLRFFSFFHFGMFVFSSMMWFIDRIKEKEIRKVHFCSRDAYIFKKVYDKFSSYFDGLPESHYLLISRDILYPASIGKNFDFSPLWSVTNPDTIKTPKKFLKIFKGIIALEKRNTALKIAESAGFDQNENLFAEKERIIKFTNFVKKELVNTSLCENYVSLIKDFYTTKIEDTDIIVDSGYNGRSEEFLTYLLDKTINSYYFTKCNNDIGKKRSDLLGFKIDYFMQFSNTAFLNYNQYEKFVKADYTSEIMEFDIQNKDVVFMPQNLSVLSYVLFLMHSNAEIYIDKILETWGDMIKTFFFRYPYIEGAIPFESFLEQRKENPQYSKILPK